MQFLPLIIWFAAFVIGLCFYAGPKELTFEKNKKRSLISGGIIMSGTLAAMIMVVGRDDLLALFIKDYVVLLGSVIGGGLFVVGIQKKIIP